MPPPTPGSRTPLILRRLGWKGQTVPSTVLRDRCNRSGFERGKKTDLKFLVCAKPYAGCFINVTSFNKALMSQVALSSPMRERRPRESSPFTQS